MGKRSIDREAVAKLMQAAPEMREALLLAEAALADLGACADPSCSEAGCNHALSKIRALLASTEDAGHD